MPVSKTELLNRIDIALSGATKPADIASLLDARSTIESTCYSVPDLASLPSAADNTGRMIWVAGICDYRVSNGEVWGRKFNSTLEYASTIWSWGCGSCGKLGNNDVLDKSSPVSIVGGFTDWCQVSVGNTTTLAIKSSGALFAWGENSLGQIGDNTTISKSSPVSVVGGFTDWCQVSAGSAHNVALRTNGTAWAWGFNNSGRLGDNTTINKSSPVSVVGGFTDWCKVSAGFSHSLGIRTNGTLWGWGYNGSGRIGNNSTVAVSSPVSVVGGFTDWTQASGGTSHTVALRSNGTVWTWGSNAVGELGDNTVVAKSSPVSVVGGFTDWCQVSAGNSHNAGVRTNGTIWAWGFNTSGRLGDGSSVTKSSPVSVVGGFTDWCQVSTAPDHTLAVRTNGTIWAWGSNICGKLGINSAADRSSPVSVVGGFADWSQVSGGGYHSAAIRKTPIGF